MSKSVSAESRINRASTLLNKDELKHKVFEERKVLVSKWFVKWNDSQRMAVLEDLINHCRLHHLEQLNLMIAHHKPIFRDDFTHILPRNVSLHIFSFLDPRSLSRCARVSWHWKTLVELDMLWEPLCRRLGWTLCYVPTPFEKGAWKRLYLNSIILLKKTVTQTSRATKEMDKLILADGHQGRQRSGVPTTDQRPPWKGSDPTPRDTWRNNYLQNDETIGKLGNARTEGRRKAAKAAMAGSALRRSNSLTRLKSSTSIRDSSDNDFSTWTQYTGGAPFMSRPMTSDFDVGPSIAFDRTHSTALISQNAVFDPAGSLPLKQPGVTANKKFDLTAVY